MREELHTLYTRQQAEPARVTAADWHAAMGRLGALTEQHAADQRRRRLPWILPADQAHDGRGVEPGAVQAMTAPAPWTPPAAHRNRAGPRRARPARSAGRHGRASRQHNMDPRFEDGSWAAATIPSDEQAKAAVRQALRAGEGDRDNNADYLPPGPEAPASFGNTWAC
jgi:hypothetical protein